MNNTTASPAQPIAVKASRCAHVSVNLPGRRKIGPCFAYAPHLIVNCAHDGAELAFSRNAVAPQKPEQQAQIIDLQQIRGFRRISASEDFLQMLEERLACHVLAE
jgi:hypothetical protein